MGLIRSFPSEPDFSTESEQRVFAAIRAQMHEGDVLLSGIRFSDAKYGDVEADFIVLMPECGAVVIEVKGGHVTYANAEFVVKSRRGQRRVHPIEQARKAKHALRRYMDRQPEWGQGLLRTEWLVVFPFTDVSGDMGPEGRRELIVDRGDLPGIMTRARAVATSPLNKEPFPHGDWVDTALSLLLRLRQDGRDEKEGIVLPRSGKKPHRSRIWISAAAALILIGAGAWWYQRPEVAACNVNYQPCVPVAVDLNCPDLAFKVTVIGKDPYRLDADHDGLACEQYP